MAANKTKNIYQLKIVLCNVRPPIWRRLLVEDTTLDKLADYIQIAMGWLGGHLHGFYIHGERYGIADPDWGADWMIDESGVRLSNVIYPGDKKFIFDYDFGDGWELDVLIEKILPAEKGRQYPVCIKGKRACPPEDVGGPWSYGEFLEAIGDRSNPRHEELLEWTGGSFDPEAFDLDEINNDLGDAENNVPLRKMFAED